MNDTIIYKYIYKDILIDLNINYFHIDILTDSEIVKYSNIFNILKYYNVFKRKNVNLANIYENPKDTLEFLIELSHKYNNTQQVLLIIYSYIISYYIYKEHYNVYAYQNRYFKKFNINYKNEVKKLTDKTFLLSVLEYKFLDEFYRTVSKYPGITDYHKIAIKNFDLLEHNIFLNNKITNKLVSKKLIDINNTSLIDDEIYLEMKTNIIKIIKEFNSKLH